MTEPPQGVRIVVVDANAERRAHIVGLVERQPSMRVLAEAASFPHALTRIRRLRPDIVVLSSFTSAVALQVAQHVPVVLIADPPTDILESPHGIVSVHPS